MKWDNMKRWAAVARKENLREIQSGKRRRDAQDQFTTEICESIRAGSIKPNEFSLRRLFEATVPDAYNAFLSTWDMGSGDAKASLMEADHLALLESGATLSSAFANITGQIVFSKVMQAYQAEEFKLTRIIPTVPTQLSGEKIPGFQQVGDNFESVGEAQAYPLLGVGEDWVRSPETVKRGGILPLTREAIFFDRTGQLLQTCQKVGEFFGANKEKRLIDAVVDENVTAHRYNWRDTAYASYQSATPWINLKAANGLTDWNNIDAAEQVLAQIVDPFTGEPIVVDPRHLIVPRRLKATARQITTAVQVRKGDGASNTAVTIGASPIDTNYEVVTSQLIESRMATKTSWFLGDASKAVVYMENWPMGVVEAPANSHLEFTQDIVRQWKVSERGAAFVENPRFLVKSTVA